VPDAPEAEELPVAPKGGPSGTTESTSRRATVRKLPEPGVLELEDLLSTYLNTRVKVDIQNRRGRLVVEFATLEDLERIYRAMVGDGGVA
jgi:ParB family chromosome partitioning protein